MAAEESLGQQFQRGDLVHVKSHFSSPERAVVTKITPTGKIVLKNGLRFESDGHRKKNAKNQAEHQWITPR
jgi:hypothetical protein